MLFGDRYGLNIFLTVADFPDDSSTERIRLLIETHKRIYLYTTQFIFINKRYIENMSFKFRSEKSMVIKSYSSDFERRLILKEFDLNSSCLKVFKIKTFTALIYNLNIITNFSDMF